MKINVHTEINTKGLDNLEKILLKTKLALRVGVLGKDSSRDDGLNNATIAAIQELGSESKKIPARSFLKMPIEKTKKAINNFVGNALKATLKNGKNIKYLLNQVGLFCVAKIQEAFDSRGFGTWAPNKPQTIKRKKSSAPLIQEGELRKSVSYDIINEK
jgi:phage gpG-like protein